MAQPHDSHGKRERVAERLVGNSRKLFEFAIRQVQARARAGPTGHPPVPDRYAFKDAVETLAELAAETLDTACERMRANLDPSPEVVDPETGHLTIIEPEEEALGLHMAALCAPVAERHGERLRRVQALLPRIGPIADPHALDPDMLLGALSARIAHTGLEENAKRLCCRLLLEAMEPHLGSFYEAACGLLRHLPPPEDAAVRAVAATRTTPAPGSLDTSGLIVIPNQVLATGTHRSVEGATVSGDDTQVPALSPFERETIIDAFTTLQREQAARAELLPPEALTRRVAAVLYAQGTFNTTHLSAAIAPVAQFVHEVFSAVLADTALPEPTRPPLAALQVPITKLAFMDMEAFRNPERPARQLLRTYTALALHATGPDADRVLQGLSRAVRHLCDRFDRDLRVPEQTLRALERLLAETERRARRREQEAQAIQKRRTRLHAAQEEVQRLYAQRTKGRTVHPRVAGFLRSAWLPCMARVLAVKGRSSAAWREHECLLEQLVLAGAGNLPLERFDMILGPLDTLEDELASLLTQCLGEPPSQLAQLMRWLRATRFRALQAAVAVGEAGRAGSLPPAPPRRRTRRSPTDTAEMVAPSEAELRAAAAAADEPTAAPLPPAVRPGTWFEIYRGSHRPKRRLKLSTILPDTGEVLFTSRTGEEVVTLPLKQFLRDLRTGRSRPIEDTNRFEEALQAVIRSRTQGET